MKRTIVCLALMGAAITAPVQAADSGFSAQGATGRFTPVEVADFAKQIERDLAFKNARLAIVYRAGRPRDKLPDGISYTHGAFWIYGDTKTADGRTVKGYAVHNLYHGDGKTLPMDQSLLKQGFPFDFISGSTADDVAVIIPSPEMQQRLIATIMSPTYAKMHIPRYSTVSNPHDAKYQNCNEFMLDVIAAAAWQTDNYTQIKANLSAHYQPTLVKTNAVMRLFAPVVDSRLPMDDHKGQIRTAAYESMATFMLDQGLMQETYVIQRNAK